jgi:hypothetical protein
VELRAAVQPVVLARARALPVHPALAGLLPNGGLVRGRTVSCRGNGAVSLALALVAEAAAAGAWLAAVDVPELGVEAATGLGVPLERLVRVDSGGTAAAWADLVKVALDGFELVLTRPPADAGEALVRRVQSQLQARGAVLVTLGERPADVVLTAGEPEWEGIGAGHGHLRARRLDVEAAGRRVPQSRHARLWLPTGGGGLAAASEAVETAGSEPVELRAAG